LPGFITSPAPHALAFTEIALVGTARGHVDVDDERIAVRPYRLLVTAAGQRRSWSLARERLAGRLVFFEPAWIEQVAGIDAKSAFPFLTGARGRRALDLDRSQFRQLARLSDEMRDELQSLRPDAAHALRALLYQMLVAVQRLFGTPPLRPIDDASPHVRAFTRLVDERYASGGRVQEYADALGISARHLNACVRRATGQCASDVIHARLIAEASERLLRHEASVSEIAETLGFSDTSYFVRFFRRHVGATPAQYRRHRARPISLPERH